MEMTPEQKKAVGDYENKLVAERLIIVYQKNWSSTSEDKIAALNGALNQAGIDAIHVQFEKDGKMVTGMEGERQEEEVRAVNFHNEINEILKKVAEDEFTQRVECVISILEEYQVQEVKKIEFKKV
jgi:hypothetical protein